MRSLFSKAVSFFVARPFAAHALLLAVLLCGWLCGSGMRTSLLPEREPDVVRVRISMPGSLPESVDAQAVAPVEAMVSRWDETREVSAVSVPGSAEIAVRAVSPRRADALRDRLRDSLRSFALPEGAVAEGVERDAFSMRGAMFVFADGDLARAAALAAEFRDSLAARGLSGASTAGAPDPRLPPGSPLGGIRLDGAPAVLVSVDQRRGEDLLEVARTARGVFDDFRAANPDARAVAFYDGTSVLGDRMRLLARNGLQGLLLVLVVLGLFLDIRVAGRVALSLPFAFAGMAIVARLSGVTFNLLSLFGMIAVAGMLVDAAIVVSEAVVAERETGAGPKEAAVRAVRRVASPVAVSALTTVAVFVPFFFFRGMIGSLVWQIAAVAIAALVFSLVAGFLVLPAELAGCRGTEPGRLSAATERVRSAALAAYGRVLRFALDRKALALAVPLCAALLLGWLFSEGILRIDPYQENDDEIPAIDVALPLGSSAETTDSLLAAAEAELRAALRGLEEECGGALLLGTMRTVGANALGDFGPHAGRILLRLVPGSTRPLHSEAIVSALRERVGVPEGAVRFRFASSGQWGSPVSVALRGDDPDELREAAAALRAALEADPEILDPVDDVVSGFDPSGRPYSVVRRADGAREALVEASLLPGVSSFTAQRRVQEEILPGILKDRPGLSWRAGPRQRDNVDFLLSVAASYAPALLLILALLLAEFRSLRQSSIVLLVIPFGVVGGLVGHLVHGEMLSNMSVFGFVALSGVIVNNAVIFVDSINRLRGGLPLREAVVAGALGRLRPVAMTTLTTVAGLAPMMLERSFQAREMVPMAFTVCWGLVVGSLLALVETPVLVELLAPRPRGDRS